MHSHKCDHVRFLLAHSQKNGHKCSLICVTFSAQFNTLYHIYIHFRYPHTVIAENVVQNPTDSMWVFSSCVAFVNTKQLFSFCCVWFLDFDRSNKMTPNGYLIFEDESFLDCTVAKMNALRKSGQFCDVRLQVSPPHHHHHHLCFRKNKHDHIFTCAVHSVKRLFLFLIFFSYAHFVCIYLIKNKVKTSIFRFFFWYVFCLKCNLFLWWQSWLSSSHYSCFKKHFLLSSKQLCRFIFFWKPWYVFQNLMNRNVL